MENYENIYNSSTRHLIPYKFIAGNSCIRIYFVRYEIFRNSFNQVWNDAFSVNMLCNFICDRTLLILTNFPPRVHNSYELTKLHLIAYFETGIPRSMLWEKLRKRRQEGSETIMDFFYPLLVLNKVVPAPDHILKLIFVEGMKTEIREHVSLNFHEPMSIRQVFFIAKKFEAINNSTIFEKTNKYNSNQKGDNYTSDILYQ